MGRGTHSSSPYSLNTHRKVLKPGSAPWWPHRCHHPWPCMIIEVVMSVRQAWAQLCTGFWAAPPPSHPPCWFPTQNQPHLNNGMPSAARVLHSTQKEIDGDNRTPKICCLKCALFPSHGCWNSQLPIHVRWLESLLVGRIWEGERWHLGMLDFIPWPGVNPFLLPTITTQKPVEGEKSLHSAMLSPLPWEGPDLSGFKRAQDAKPVPQFPIHSSFLHPCIPHSLSLLNSCVRYYAGAGIARIKAHLYLRGTHR